MLSISTKIEEENTCVISLSGEFNFFEQDSVLEYLGKVRDDKPSGVIFDLSEIAFIDSAGVGILITTISRFQKDGIKTALVLSDNAHVLRRLGKQLQLIGLTEKFYDTIDEAIAEMYSLDQPNL
jgi:anti-sigma B factor antagonist